MKFKVIITIFLVGLVVTNYLLISRNKQLAGDLRSQKVSVNKVIKEKRNSSFGTLGQFYLFFEKRCPFKKIFF